MKFTTSASVEQLQVISRFESLRKILLTEQYAEHLQKPLAYWALPTDRRLPLALLGRPLDELLNTPFAELSQTPGIGQKKVASLVNLLARAANTDPAELPVEVADLKPEEAAAGGNGKATNGDGYDPAAVTEVTWAQWRASVIRHALQNEMLGRFAPTLQNMTRVIWDAPLSAYTDDTLREIRARKTHGEKRVQAVIDVFHAVYTLIGNMGVQDHMVVRLVPKRIDGVERWIGAVLQSPAMPTEEEIFENFIGPLLEQVRVDATQQIASLAENRLGITGAITSVRQAARTMGLTRARVYQLLNEINDIMNVRWPDGRHQAYELAEKLQNTAADAVNPPNLQQFQAAIELFYPGSRRGAAGPLEQTALDVEEDAEEIDELATAAV